MALQTDPTQLNGNIFDLTSLRGGLDDTSPYMALASDACVLAENIEFVKSTLGERRRGCEPIGLSTDVTGNNAIQADVWMYRHLPTNSEGDAELWTLTQSLSDNTSVLTRRKQAGWETIVPNDAFTVTDGFGHRLSAQTLHGKLFISGKTAVDRLHVFDGISLRRTGLAEPSAPTAADDVTAGTFSTTRYYRVRYILEDGSSEILIRSEPSDSVTFTPSGTKDGAVVTKPVTINENETHWEVEASLDNANFYRIATVAIGTTTYLDTTDATVGYNTTDNPLSEDIGAYTLMPSGKFVVADEDRLLVAGSYEDPAEASRVRWTPVYAEIGVGNDERMDSTTDPFIDLDGFEGGEITGMSRAVIGYIYVFKRSHIYRLVRTGTRVGAYNAIPLTKARGALPGSLVEAMSQEGSPALYFLDENVGPCRLGINGLQWCGRDIQGLWSRVNVNATVPCHGVYYNLKRQLHYWLAVDGADTPNIKIILHVNEMQDTDEGGRRGWVTVGLNNRIATAHCSVMFADNVDTTDPRSFTLVPFIGKERWTVGTNTITDYIQICDVGSLDADTTGDTESSYLAAVTSRPFAMTSLLNQYEIKSGVIMAKAADTPDGSVFVQIIRDFGKEIVTIPVTIYADSETTETHVVRQLDDLNISELYAVQISLGDLDTNVTPPDYWELHRLQLKITPGQSA